ncbi:uncharacterized protein FRV6_11708 [Fusarium oxysporum]|uniref:Uncharacterized protein n=1 Tax=Fusarium oxysporum TaxID=5507 RepID=A0A2H3TPE9_FUSOX|nr:uncharacterized protein FRV6_11708 [Fusarium oxysporum]
MQLVVLLLLCILCFGSVINALSIFLSLLLYR